MGEEDGGDAEGELAVLGLVAEIDEISFVLQEKPVADGVYLIPIVK